MPGPVSNDEKCAQLSKFGLFKAASRIMAYSHGLPDVEMRIVQFVFIRTLLWNNSFEEISERDFLEGPMRPGGRLAFPIGCSPEELHAGIESLVERGVLFRTNIGGTLYYGVNLNWRLEGMRPIWRLHERDWDWETRHHSPYRLRFRWFVRAENLSHPSP